MCIKEGGNGTRTTLYALCGDTNKLDCLIKQELIARSEKILNVVTTVLRSLSIM